MVFHAWKHPKIAVSSDLEKALEKTVGRLELQRIYRKLNELYMCGIIGCYDNPQYLKKTLENMYGNEHLVILEQLKKEANESEHKIWFEAFIERLSSWETPKIEQK